MEENWKDIEGQEGRYQVSDLGNVRSSCRLKTNHLLKPNKNQRYRSVTLIFNGKKKQCNIHRLVAKAFIPNPDNKETVNHINFDKFDNRVVNLEWCTSIENTMHFFKNGKVNAKRGEENHNAKIDATTVIIIRECCEKFGYGSYAKLARYFNISQSHVRDIVNKRRWKHL